MPEVWPGDAEGGGAAGLGGALRGRGGGWGEGVIGAAVGGDVSALTGAGVSAGGSSATERNPLTSCGGSEAAGGGGAAGAVVNPLTSCGGAAGATGGGTTAAAGDGGIRWRYQ